MAKLILTDDQIETILNALSNARVDCEFAAKRNPTQSELFLASAKTYEDVRLEISNQ